MTGIAKTTLTFGMVLLLLALGFYFGTGRESWTSLIPGIWGAIYIVLGLAARTPRSTMIAMHIAAVFALLGTLTIGRPISTLGEAPTNALIAQFALAILNLILLIIYIRSFIAARRSRSSES